MWRPYRKILLSNSLYRHNHPMFKIHGGWGAALQMHPHDCGDPSAKNRRHSADCYPPNAGGCCGIAEGPPRCRRNHRQKAGGSALALLPVAAIWHKSGRRLTIGESEAPAVLTRANYCPILPREMCRNFVEATVPVLHRTPEPSSVFPTP